MIKSKKIFVGAALLAFATAFSFAQNVTFENRLSTRTVNITIADNETKTEFGGIIEKTSAEYSSDKLDLGVTTMFQVLKTDKILTVGKSQYGNLEFLDDYFIEFKPIAQLGIGFHRSYAIAGSAIPNLETDIKMANIGSDFGIFVRPIEGLVIAGGLDFISEFGNDAVKPMFNFGAEYSFDGKITFGAAARNIASKDDRSFGAYASYTGIQALTLNAGYTYNANIEYKGFPIISGKNMINASVMYFGMPVSIVFDSAYAIDEEKDFAMDLYAGLTLSYMIDNNWTASLWSAYTNDFDNEKNYWLAFSPTVSYKLNEKNTIGAGIYFDFSDSPYSNPQKIIAFPLSWTYRF